MKIYSPNNIEVLLHCYLCPEPHPRIDVPAVQDAIDLFMTCGAIEPDPGNRGGYVTTLKGEAWVRALCNVGEPRAAYVDDHGEILDYR